jgi:hypothetical protein
MTERVTIATPYTQQHGRSANHDQWQDDCAINVHIKKKK